MPYSKKEKSVNNVYQNESAREKKNTDFEIGKSVGSAYKKTPEDILHGVNPFLNKEGGLKYKQLDYRGLLDGTRVNDVVKSFIEDATGLKRKTAKGRTYSEEAEKNISGNELFKMDVTEMPKLSENQISTIIGKFFSKSPVISVSDAGGIYKAQQNTGMSALAILSIGALESGYGTSSIAKAKNNIWGWGAANKNPSANAKSFSQMSDGAGQFASGYMKTYYNKYGAKSIYDAGTGNNPAGMGYAYYDNGGIDSSWASKVGSIMKKFYDTVSESTPKTAGGAAETKSASSGGLVGAAKRLLGVPYVWGGTSPKGFDCSGLVQYVAGQNGISTHRVSKDQYKYDGQKVESQSELQPGDLLFFDTHGKNDGNVSHVGIYAGDGKMIHAPHTGDVVKIVNFSKSSYYQNAYVGAKRL